MLFGVPAYQKSVKNVIKKGRNVPDLAFAADSANLQAKAFADTLPTRLLGPDLNGQPPATISFNDVESQARTCYESAGDRAAYLGSVTKEVGRIGKYINAINQYLETLGQRDRGGRQHGDLPGPGRRQRR